MSKEIRAHQIEELLLNAHLESEGGIDLIEEYFSMNSSLDSITTYAQELLKKESDPRMRRAIIRNLSECIVVKSQFDRRSIFGVAKRVLQKFGMSIGKHPEILRAETLIKNSTSPSSDQAL